ncbi:MAG: S1 family peptidase [Elainellaceae cyanobacterium]
MKIYSSMISVISALIATVGVSSVAQSITIRHDSLDVFYQNRGYFFPSVGRLQISDSFSNASTCSGTLIAAHWVLTAAHCTDGLSAASFDIGQFTYPVAYYYTYPDWLQSGGNLFRGVDIALLQLNTPVHTVAPSLLNTGFNEVGQISTAVGFGDTGTGITGPTSNDGLKRAADNVVDATGLIYGWSDTLLLTDFDHPLGTSNRLGSPTPLLFEGATANGDSGGALFINGVLAGVTSFGYPVAASRYGNISGFTRVSAFFPWISSIVNGQSTAFRRSQSGSPYPTNDSHQTFALADDEAAIARTDVSESVPEPSMLVGLLTLVGLLKLMSRRR